VEGTKNVMKSVIETKSVKRVVLVSSCVAVYCVCERFFNKERFVYDEECWNGLDEEHSEECRKNKGPEKSYFAAKTAAEKEAWRMVKEANEKDPQRHLTLVTICPPVIFGSLLSSPTIETLNTSMQLLPGLFFGGDTGGTGITDADDVAESLFRAMTYPEANGRYICCGGSYHYSELSAKLAKLFPEKCFAEEIEDNSLIPIFKVDKIKKELNMNFTPIEETLKKSVDSLIQKNCLLSM